MGTNGQATITAGKMVSSGGSGVYVEQGTLTIGTNETTPSVSTTVPNITGSTYGVKIASGTFNFYDGVIQSTAGAGTSINGTVGETPTGYGVCKTTANGTESAILVPKHYAEVNSSALVVNYYRTLAMAMSHVTDGNTIQALENITETTAATLASGKTATFSPGGKTVTLKNATLTNRGTLTINGTGTLTSSQGNTILNRGTLNKNGRSSITNTAQAYAIETADGTVTLSAGTISSNGRAIGQTGSGQVIVSGATVTGEDVGLFNAGTAELTASIKVTSGTVESTSAHGIYNYSTGSAEITGGTIKGKDVAVRIDGGKLTVSGGTITGETGIALNSSSTSRITAGTITGTVNMGVLKTDGGLYIGTTGSTTPTITGKQYGVEDIGGTTIRWNGGVINGQSGSGSAINVTPGIPSGYTIQKTTASGVETAKLVASASTTSASNNTSAYSLKSSSLLNTAYSAVAYSIGENANNSNTEVTDGDKNSTDEIEANDSNGNTNVDEEIKDTTVAETNDSDGSANSTNSKNEESNDTIVVKTLNVARVAGENYDTLADAINSANSGQTIEVLENISLTEQVTIDESKNIKLNLNGKTITSTSLNTITNKGILTIISNGIIKNETDNGIVINNYGTLYMQNGVITTANNGGKAINNEGTFEMTGGKIVTEGIGSNAVYNNDKSEMIMNAGIIEITGFGSKAIYNNSSVVIGATAGSTASSSTSSTTSNSGNTAKIVVSGDDSIGIYNSKEATVCDIKSGEILIEAEVIENYELIKNTNEFKAELEQIKPSYGIYNNSDISVNIEEIIIKVERLKSIGILNNAEGDIVLGKLDTELNLATPIIYAIADNTTAIVNVNTQKGKIKYYDGSFVTIISVKDEITDVLQEHEIAENKGNSLINTILKKIEESKVVDSTENSIKSNSVESSADDSANGTANSGTSDTANGITAGTVSRNADSSVDSVDSAVNSTKDEIANSIGDITPNTQSNTENGIESNH